MKNWLPLLIVGAIIGLFSAVLIFVYAFVKDKKEAMGFSRKMKDGALLKRLLVYAKPYWKNFVAVAFVMLISVAYDIVSPLLVSGIEELVKADFQLPDLVWRVVLYAGILIVSLVSSYIQAIVLQITGQKIISALREDAFKHIESLSHEQLAKVPVGTLVTRVTNDTNSISMMFTGLLVNLIKNSFVIVGVFVAMMCVNYMLTLMVLCFVPFVVLFAVIFRKFSRRAFRRVKDGFTDVNTFLSENLSGMKIIQIFNREAHKMKKFEEKCGKLYKAQREQIFVFGIFRPAVYMLYISSVLCLLFLGSKGYLDGWIVLGQKIESQTVVAFYMFISKFFNPIQNLAEQFHRLQSAFASAEKIFTVMDITPSVVDEADAIELDEVKGEIEFRNVWFAYNEGEWVLKDVSFHIDAKQTVAFVGATGSGKTTILSLLCRNYDIQQGEILLDGVNIKNIKISSLRKHFGQMLQDVFLFAGTVRSNIVLREESFTDEQVLQACKYVNADKFIDKLGHGLDEEVRERGNNFSSGQRQLLSFARTIIHKPEVMILDEATANIDTETEVLIQDSLSKLMNVGTMLIVAHRLSTIQHADNIIVLSHGEIVEQGSHDQLLKRKGRYYDLYTLQFNKAQLQAKAAK
ncbi:MAG: ABC transporter ATP-binding protein/permease [Corallococcus sp.]|nr:ABC transporter ATP-binding protein/permease [Corallococcus sp.]MCM1359829.1 ABC transporter ATP-binding protein/permease [Corallococcus sp.]MCM1395263.1 ABC transporter ATP-binding protein/permease [Corallococcus sp.]